MNKEEVEDKMRIDPEYRQQVADSITEANNRDNPEIAKIELAKCYENIIEVYKDYLDVPEDYIKLWAVTNIATYFHSYFNTFPITFFNAMRGSGKTRTLKLFNILSKGGDGCVVNNITEAVLFRHPTGVVLCIDEMEKIGSKEKQTLRELLNATYKKGTIVRRMKKIKINGQEQQAVEAFEPYFPLALANIWGIEEVLSDRAITYTLEKSNNPRKTKLQEDFDTNPTILEIKRTLERFSVVCACSLASRMYREQWNCWVREKYNIHDTLHTYNTYTTLTTHNNIIDIENDEMFLEIDKSGLTGRNLELIFPLLITAEMLSHDIFIEILNISKEIVSKKQEEEYATSKDISLYEFVAEHGKNEWISVKEICSHFRLYVGDATGEDAWLNEYWLGRALKRLNLILERRRLASGIFVIVNVLKAKEKLKIFK